MKGWGHATRAIEGMVLFVGLPLVFYMEPIRLPKLPSLWVLTLYCWAILWTDRGFDRRRLGNLAALGPFVRAAWPRMLAVLAVLAALAYAFDPGMVFWFPCQRPGIWLMVMVGYPLLSAYPQEMIYRTFLFRRYRAFFGEGRGMAGASALAFGFLHLIYDNPVAVGLSLLGGWFFAQTYRQTGSTLAATFEHALYGCWIFTVGWGRFFYEGW